MCDPTVISMLKAQRTSRFQSTESMPETPAIAAECDSCFWRTDCRPTPPRHCGLNSLFRGLHAAIQSSLRWNPVSNTPELRGRHALFRHLRLARRAAPVRLMWCTRRVTATVVHGNRTPPTQYKQNTSTRVHPVSQFHFTVALSLSDAGLYATPVTFNQPLFYRGMLTSSTDETSGEKKNLSSRF